MPAADREATKPSAPAADALNLWVLSRPKGDLPTPAQPVAPTPPSLDTRIASVSVAVVLGVGHGTDCAEHWAQQAVDALSASRDPRDVLSSVLDSARRWRWPDVMNTFSATMASSEGAFGGVQSAPPSVFNAALLRHALERHAVLGGPLAHWPPAGGELPVLVACTVNVEPNVAGPIGVLLRNRVGHYYAGVVHLDPLADAGVVSISAQYGVSLAVGASGGVLMSAGCNPPPLDRLAERVYASPDWVAATTKPQAPGGCNLGYALLTDARGWVAPPGVLAGAVVEAAPITPPPGPSPPDFAPDAGAAEPSVTP
jgi:hypothetical protein